jgi:F0F1-type ATP synthase assembly protein I
MHIYPHIQETLGILIVLMPVTLFALIIRYFVRKIAEDKIKLIDLLAEPDATPTRAITEGEPAPASKRSASRFILFITGITTLVITVCFATYYFYIKIYAINGGADPDLEGFTNVILALGIGVVPYTVNQVKKIRL